MGLQTTRGTNYATSIKLIGGLACMSSGTTRGVDGRRMSTWLVWVVIAGSASVGVSLFSAAATWVQVDYGLLP